MRFLIFGREPAAIVASIQAVLVLAVSFGWLEGVGLDSQDDVALVVAVLTALAAVLLAYITSETLLAPVVELFKASLALAAIYGLSITEEQTGMVISAIVAVFAAFHRTQTSPLEYGSFEVKRPVA